MKLYNLILASMFLLCCFLFVDRVEAQLDRGEQSSRAARRWRFDRESNRQSLFDLRAISVHVEDLNPDLGIAHRTAGGEAV